MGALSPAELGPDLSQTRGQSESESPYDGAYFAPVLAEGQSVLSCGVNADPGVIVFLLRTRARLARHVAALLARVHWTPPIHGGEYPPTRRCTPRGLEGCQGPAYVRAEA